jgi:hypothetical protein
VRAGTWFGLAKGVVERSDKGMMGQGEAVLGHRRGRGTVTGLETFVIKTIIEVAT